MTPNEVIKMVLDKEIAKVRKLRSVCGLCDTPIIDVIAYLEKLSLTLCSQINKEK